MEWARTVEWEGEGRGGEGRGGMTVDTTATSTCRSDHTTSACDSSDAWDKVGVGVATVTSAAHMPTDMTSDLTRHNTNLVT